MSKKPRTVYEHEKPAIEDKHSFYLAQNQMIAHWDKKYKTMLREIKKDIEIVVAT